MKVHFEFFGGPRHNSFLSGDSSSADIVEFDIDEATCLYWETGYAVKNAEFTVFERNKLRTHHEKEQHLPPNTTLHRYRISGRLEADGEVFVLATYLDVVLPENIPDDERCPWYERLVNLGVSEVVSVHSSFPQMPTAPV